MSKASILTFFEGSNPETFYPLSQSHFVGELRCGLLNLVDKWRRRLPHTDAEVICRPQLPEPAIRRTGLRRFNPSDASSDRLFVDPGFLPSSAAVEALISAAEDTVFVKDNRLVALFMNADSESSRYFNGRLKGSDEGGMVSQLLKEIASSATQVEVDVEPLSYLWDLVSHNSAQIVADFELLRREWADSDRGGVDSHSLFYGEQDIYICRGARIDGQVVLDARGGPIYVGRQSVILPHTRVEGPAVIDQAAQLVGGKVRTGCTIGPYCRVGGELEESIMHGYSNKYHEGFIGHAYIGEWVNLGALTTNSDLKNNYGPVRVELPDGVVDSGLSKVGSFIGDHSKTGIGTLLTTGMVIGFCTNLFGGGMVAEKLLPSFLWGSAEGLVEYQLSKALSTAETVMKRRGQSLDESVSSLFHHIFNSEADIRNRYCR
jgi:UDP-N-acetylglucosamine diphosphorylase/glucosamine-1-phosphate N-acetyltransferase